MTFLAREFADPVVLELHFKYGFDGTNANGWKQKWQTGDGNDQHIFCSSIVPLQLQNVANGEVLWTNPRPSSTRLCRPVKIEFVRETTELCKQEEHEFNEQILNLQPCLILNASIIFKLSLTMIDGKVSDLFAIHPMISIVQFSCTLFPSIFHSYCMIVKFWTR